MRFMDWRPEEASWEQHEMEGNMTSNDLLLQTQNFLNSNSKASGLVKKPRLPPNGFPTTVRCLVDGCRFDLTNCRDYYVRHKVCEIHSKTPQVTICGVKKRFCQQCSRFHSLDEFDGEKRSCRKRLDGHNRRRRKPRTEILARALYNKSTLGWPSVASPLSETSPTNHHLLPFLDGEPTSPNMVNLQGLSPGFNFFESPKQMNSPFMKATTSDYAHSLLLSSQDQMHTIQGNKMVLNSSLNYKQEFGSSFYNFMKETMP